jgi:hypothetical protein
MAWKMKIVLVDVTDKSNNTSAFEGPGNQGETEFPQFCDIM